MTNDEMNPITDPQFNQNTKKINLLIDFSEEDDFQKSGKIKILFFINDNFP